MAIAIAEMSNGCAEMAIAIAFATTQRLFVTKYWQIEPSLLTLLTRYRNVMLYVASCVNAIATGYQKSSQRYPGLLGPAKDS